MCINSEEKALRLKGVIRNLFGVKSRLLEQEQRGRAGWSNLQ